MPNWASIGVKARLMVNNIEFECVRANVAYQLNSVPYAQFMVAVGRGKAGLLPAAIHTNQIATQVPLKYYVTLEALAGDEDPNLPVGEFLLFDGYLTGINWNKSRQHEHAVLQAKNFLLDMDYSSSLSDSSHPLNPSQFTYRAAHNAQGAGGFSWTPQTQNGFITAGVLASDFWGDGLAKWLHSITQDDMINNIEMSQLGQPGKNDTAASALARFTTTDGEYVPLVFDMHEADSTAVSDAIWNDVQMETYESFANVTLWNKLVNDFGSRYLFAVVPRVSDAVVVPYIPGLRTLWKNVINANEYDLLGASAQLIRVLRGVGVFSGLNSRTGADGREPGQDPIRLGIGGWYNPPGLDRGMVMLKQGPRWLSNIISADRYSQFSTGGGVKPIGTSMNPGAGQDGGPAKPQVLKEQSKQLLDAYAEALYVYEQLKLRQLELSGKARFDISPGSTISVEVAGDRYIEADVLTKTLIGDVIRVTYNIDSETPKISTNFHIAHVRTSEENEIDGFSIERHPLWTEVWAGAELGVVVDDGVADATNPANG